MGAGATVVVVTGATVVGACAFTFTFDVATVLSGAVVFVGVLQAAKATAENKIIVSKRRITYTLLLAVGRRNIVPLLGWSVAMALRP